MIEGLIITLLVAFIAANVAWMLYTQRLLNKLMSRNYHDYVATRIQEANQPKTAKGPENPKGETFAHPKEDLRTLTAQILR